MLEIARLIVSGAGTEEEPDGAAPMGWSENRRLFFFGEPARSGDEPDPDDLLPIWLKSINEGAGGGGGDGARSVGDWRFRSEIFLKLN
jgi:hypothetical protein